jgi:chromosome segregation ATPase
VSADFARELERELAVVWRERSEFAKRIDEADATLAQRTAERDALAEEVDRLRLQVEISDHCVAVLKAERDEARRIACSAYAEWRRDLATERNWDCWKKEVDP